LLLEPDEEIRLLLLEFVVELSTFPPFDGRLRLGVFALGVLAFFAVVGAGSLIPDKILGDFAVFDFALVIGVFGGVLLRPLLGVEDLLRGAAGLLLRLDILLDSLFVFEWLYCLR